MVETSVLVVDDEGAFRATAVRMLTRMGLSVVAEASTAHEAMTAAQAHRPQAALVDVRLPEGDGLALAAALAALPWSPRVVVTSTDPEATTDQRVRGAGAVGFIAKEDLPGSRLRAMLTGDTRVE
jgi:CheY-like chemotaxis protein